MMLPTKKQYSAILAMSAAKITMHTGAVRSGKTVSVCFALPILVQRHKRQEGLSILCTKSLRNAELNVLMPARIIYGDTNIGYIKDKSYVIIFGEKFYILPFNDESSYQKIQGTTVKLCIADELVLAPESFFNMLLSRLSLPDSQLIGTMNPSAPKHYIKRYIDNEFIDEEHTVKKRIFKWTLEDNPTLDPLYVSGLKAAYKGNDSLYRRYILGEWTAADGLAYFSYSNKNATKVVDWDDIKLNTRAVVLGIDPANLRDSTGGAPLFIDYLDRAITLKRFKHNPKTSVKLSNIEQIALLKRYIADLRIDELDNLELKIMVVDCAAADMILGLRSAFPDWDIVSYTKKNIQRRLDVCNNQLASGNIKIYECADYDYYNNEQTNEDGLLIELESVTVKDSPTGTIALDPTIPNDVSDAWAYAVAYWYKYRNEAEDADD